MARQSCDWNGCYQALFEWIKAGTDVPATRIRGEVNRDMGEAKGPAPKAVISFVSLAPLSQAGQKPWPQVLVHRITIIGNTTTTAGITFYPDTSFDGLVMSVAATSVQTNTQIAAALLAEISDQLPTGYSASIDPDDSTSILLTGDSDHRIFASTTINAARTTVSVARPARPTLLEVEARLVWRVTFRASNVAPKTSDEDAADPQFAAAYMTQAIMSRKTKLDPGMRLLGFHPAGIVTSQPSVPADRGESAAVLDIAVRGLLTDLDLAGPPMRRAGMTSTAA